MNVTIIGSGNMPRGIGFRLAAGGNDVRILDRSQEKAGTLAGEIRGDARAAVTAGAFGDPVEGDIVVLAVPYGAVASIAERYALGSPARSSWT